MLKRKGYLCGPTVYDTPHIGNIKTFYTAIKHFYTHRTSREILLLNYTDIGDKIYDRAGIGQGLIPYINHYTRKTTDLLKQLGLKPWVLDIHRASLNIKKIKKDISLILKHPSWSTKIDALGIRGLLNCEKEQDFDWSDCTTDFPDKSTAADFSLWRSGKYPLFKFNNSIPAGIPGWHNECASLVHHYCDNSFTHYGGVDLKQLHHKNECALFSALGDHQVKWIHVQPICVSLDSRQKMSKSKNTGLSIRAEDCKKWIPFLDSLSMKKVNIVNPVFIKSEKRLLVKPHMRSKRKILSYFYKRQNAKIHKNFSVADQLRSKLCNLGVKCRDRNGCIELYR